MSWRKMVELNDKLSRETGERYCRSCNRFKRIEGGRTTVARNNKRMWRCRQCAERSNPKGIR